MDLVAELIGILRIVSNGSQTLLRRKPSGLGADFRNAVDRSDPVTGSSARQVAGIVAELESGSAVNDRDDAVLSDDGGLDISILRNWRR